MSSAGETGEKKSGPSRRDILKLGGIGVLALAFGSLTACNPEEEVLPPQYKDVPEGSSLDLKVNGKDETSNIMIAYAPSGATPVERLQIRIVNGESKFLSFQDGASRIRMLEEILDPILQPLVKNPELSDNITVSYYPSASAPISTLDHEGLAEKADIWGIPVAVALQDWMLNGNPPPSETNAHLPGEKWMNLNEFGKGWAIGKLDKTSADKDIFRVMGYVLDSRALEVDRSR